MLHGIARLVASGPAELVAGGRQALGLACEGWLADPLASLEFRLKRAVPLAYDVA